jgi:hypothetical protein
MCMVGIEFWTPLPVARAARRGARERCGARCSRVRVSRLRASARAGRAQDRALRGARQGQLPVRARRRARGGVPALAGGRLRGRGLPAAAPRLPGADAHLRLLPAGAPLCDVAGAGAKSGASGGRVHRWLAPGHLFANTCSPTIGLRTSGSQSQSAGPSCAAGMVQARSAGVPSRARTADTRDNDLVCVTRKRVSVRRASPQSSLTQPRLDGV